MSENKIFGEDRFDHRYFTRKLHSKLMRLINLTVEGNYADMKAESLLDSDDIILGGLENIMSDKGSSQKRLINIYNHLSLADIPLVRMLEFDNNSEEDIPRIYGGSNLRFPIITKKALGIKPIYDIDKGGMISVERVRDIKGHNEDRRSWIEGVNGAVIESMGGLLGSGINVSMFLTDGRAKDGSENGKEARALKMLPQISGYVNRDLEDDKKKMILVQPVAISYERTIGDWTFGFQSRLKKKGLHRLHLLVDAWSFQRYIRKEPKGLIHIDYLEPISVSSEDDGPRLYKGIKDYIGKNIRVSSPSIVAHILKSYGGEFVSKSDIYDKIESYKNIMVDNGIRMFENVQRSGPEEILDRGVFIMSHKRKCPGVIMNGKECAYDTGYNTVRYYANRFRRWEHLFKSPR